MELVIDFLLLAASGTAGLFCWVLSRKLKAITSAEAGLGAGIAALSNSAEDMKKAVAETKSSADETAARIEGLLGEADAKAAHLQGLIAELGDIGESLTGRVEGATRKYLDTLAPFLDEANEAADRLLGVIAEASRHETPLSGEATSPESEDARRGDDQTGEYFVIDETQDSAKDDLEETGAAA